MAQKLPPISRHVMRDQMGNIIPPRSTDGRVTSVYWYAVNVASITALASASANINFDADSVFVWTKTSYFVDLSAAAITDGARPIPLVTVQMTDTSSSRNLTSTAVPIDSLAGRMGSEPCILPIARAFMPSSTLRFTFTNYSAATTYTNLYFMLHGYKVYDSAQWADFK